MAGVCCLPPQLCSALAGSARSLLVGEIFANGGLDVVRILPNDLECVAAVQVKQCLPPRISLEVEDGIFLLNSMFSLESP